MNLKSCPKCNGDAYENCSFDEENQDSTEYIRWKYSIWCSDCGFHTSEFDSKEEAVQAWNLTKR